MYCIDDCIVVLYNVYSLMRGIAKAIVFIMEALMVEKGMCLRIKTHVGFFMKREIPWILKI